MIRLLFKDVTFKKKGINSYHHFDLYEDFLMAKYVNWLYARY